MNSFLTMMILLALGAAALVAVGNLIHARTAPASGGRVGSKAPLPRPAQPLKRQAVSPPAATVLPLRRPAPAMPAATPRPQRAPGGDLIALAGFADKGYMILPPTPISAPGVRSRVDELTTGKRFRGGLTNLAAGLDIALPLLEKAKPDRIRKLIIVSDGEPNKQLEQLPLLAARARMANVRICAIHVGPAGSGNEIRRLTETTPGGWYTEARTVGSLASAIRKAASDTQAHRSSRKAVVVFAVDGSSSMSEPIDGSGTSRIEALRKAIQDYLTVHVSNYGKN
jgi:Mg-chelatase subunit ChlD